VSVSNKGEIPSDHDAIGMTDPFWVGINKAWEKRVVTQGNLYITGSITVEPIVQQFDKVTVGLVGDGKVGRCSRDGSWRAAWRAGGQACVTCCTVAWCAVLCARWGGLGA
jgi:hypothetical protein